MSVTLEIPDDVLAAMPVAESQQKEYMLLEIACVLYSRNVLSLGKAAELAGYAKLDFIERLKIEQEPIFDYGEEEMASILADVAKLP